MRLAETHRGMRMREIIQCQVGGAGNRIGVDFWELINDEHGINQYGEIERERSSSWETIDENNIKRKRTSIYYNEGTHGRLIPRAILVDLEAGVLDRIRGSAMGELFRPDNFICKHTGASNNWAKGFYTDGDDIRPSVMDVIRREVESCDCLQGFQFVHSICGGTGSGLGSSLMDEIREEFPSQLVWNHSLLPSHKGSDTVVEPYNAVLTLNHLIDSSDVCCVFDNDALNNLCTHSSMEDSSKYKDMNRLIATVMSGVTSSVRFPAHVRGDLRKLAVNLVPFPRIHFMVNGIAPLVKLDVGKYHAGSITEIMQQQFRNLLCTVDPNRGKFLSTVSCIRGDASISEVEQQIRHFRHSRSSFDVDWLPDNFVYTLSSAPKKELPLSSVLLANNTSLKSLWKAISDRFQTLFKRKAFLHLFTEEGMEQMEFEAAYNNLQDLISEYEQYESFEVSDEIEKGEEEEEEEEEEEDIPFTRS